MSFTIRIARRILIHIHREIRTIKVLGKLLYCMYKFCFVCQGRHGGHVDHVKDLAEVLNHVQVVKNPDLVRFCDRVREIRTIKVLDEFL